MHAGAHLKAMEQPPAIGALQSEIILLSTEPFDAAQSILIFL
jgi:hypothetical protein